MKNENIEQLQAENQRLKSELENVERVYLDDYNKICQHRDEILMKLEDLEPEAAAYKNTLNQLLSKLLFPPPGVIWTGTGEESLEDVIEKVTADNRIKVATHSPKQKAGVVYLRPKE